MSEAFHPSGFQVNHVVIAQRRKRRLTIVINNKAKQPARRNTPFDLLKDKAPSEPVDSEVKKFLDLGNSQGRPS